MSAAFDVVDNELLLEKLKLYGFDRRAVHIDLRQSTLMAACLAFCHWKLGSLRDPSLGLCCTLSSPMSCLKWFIRPTAHIGVWRQACSAFNVKSVVVCAVMQMIAHILLQVVILWNSLKSCLRNTMFLPTSSQLTSLRLMMIKLIYWSCPQGKKDITGTQA